MMNTMINKKLSTEELEMVNGGSDITFVQSAKLLYGWFTDDPEAIVTLRLLAQFDKSQSEKEGSRR